MRKNPTPAEAFFWKKVRNRKFQNLKFNRQYVIKHTEILGKEYFYIPDFYCHQIQLIIELDGKIHQTQIEYDQIREDVLKKMEYTIIRFTNDDVLQNWSKVAEKITTVSRQQLQQC